MTVNSRAPGFYATPLADRRAWLAAQSGIELSRFAELDHGGIDTATADAMVENAIGTIALPLGVALNFRINGSDVLVPMATEEPSVIAAASHAAKRVRACGGFSASADESWMSAQIALYDVADVAQATRALDAARAELMGAVDASLPRLCARGGGARALAMRAHDGVCSVRLTVDVRDAMGANILNGAAERIGPEVARVCDARLGMCIVDNTCNERLARAEARLSFEAVDEQRGAEVARAVAEASLFAERDDHRAVTHNKGIMNGVDAVVVATGNDWRGVEAAAHAWAARSGHYRPLATWRLESSSPGGARGDALVGSIELPLALGTVGGALRAHGGARLALEWMKVSGARELCAVVAAVGLASNFAALRALATEGIQRGHMALHRRGPTGGEGWGGE